jgi:hypothetical protein
MSNDLLAKTIVAYRHRVIETQAVLDKCRGELGALETEAERRRLHKPEPSTLTFAEWRKANPKKHIISYIREQASHNFEI